MVVLRQTMLVAVPAYQGGRCGLSVAKAEKRRGGGTPACRFGFAAMTEPGCVMASDRQQELFSEIEQAQDELRESIEHSRRLVERSDALIRQVKDQSADLAGDAQAAR